MSWFCGFLDEDRSEFFFGFRGEVFGGSVYCGGFFFEKKVKSFFGGSFFVKGWVSKK